MAQEAAVPISTVRELARQIAREEVAKFARSGFLRNASITGGAGLTIADGGRLTLLAPDGTVLFYIGPVEPSLPDGTPQQGWVVRRADGTGVLDLFDIDTSDGVLRQALNWRDRAGNVVLADDTDSGQGVARPWVPGVWERSRSADWPTATSTSFETVYRAKMPKQHPRLRTSVYGWSDTSGATGEIKVLVNGAQLGSTVTTSNSTVQEYLFGPSAVAGAHTSELVVEVQARVASGSGGVRLCPSTPPEGRQT